ncbi:TonB-dependent siderophore myxochelin receptor MxcH, partial [Pyxidicoccus sp. 3LFB2]
SPVLAGAPQSGGAEAAPVAAPAIEAPKLVEFAEAAYPAQAEQERREATVLLRLSLDAQGAVTEAEVLQSASYGFDEAARDAALRFRFEPAKRNGVPMPSRIAYSYEFRLPQPAETSVAQQTPGQGVPAATGDAASPTRSNAAGDASTQGAGAAPTRTRSPQAPTSAETAHRPSADATNNGTHPQAAGAARPPADVPDAASTDSTQATSTPAAASDVSTQDSTETVEAAPDPDTIEAIEVTVEGESEAQRLRESAEAVRVIDTEQLQREAVDLGQALARTEGIGVRRAGGLGSRSRFSLAGLTDEQIRFFIDGVPLELAGYGPEFANVPVNFVQRMEVYQGVVPVRFGADSLGGAVQIVTTEEVRGTRAAASYEIGSFDTHRLTLSGRHLHEPTGLFVRASGFFDSTPNDYRVDVEVPDDLGRLVPRNLPRFHDAFRAGGGAVEAGFVERPWARRLLLRAFANTTAKEIQHDVTMETPYGDVDSGSASAGATLRFEQAYESGLTADAVGGYVFRRSHFTDVGTCAYDWFGRCIQQLPQPGEIESRAVERVVRQNTGFVRANVGWTLSPDHVFRLAFAPTWVGRSGEDRALQSRGEVDPLTGARSILSLVTGLEYEHDALDGRLENIAFLKDYLQLSRADLLLPNNTFQPADQDIHHLGVGDSLRFRLSQALIAKASYEWASRLPRPDELFGDGILYGENLLLKPERSHNLNLELALSLPDTSAGELRGSVLGFGRLVDDFIQPVGREGYFTYQNVIEARSLGVSGAAGWTSPGRLVSLDGNATFQDFRNTSTEGPFAQFEGQRLPNRPHLLANGSARFHWTEVASPRDELSLSWHTRYIHSFFRAWEQLGQGASKQSIDAQLLHSLALTYVTRTSRATLSWTVDVQNLTDVSAFDFMGVQRPGRTVAAKLIAEL